MSDIRSQTPYQILIITASLPYPPASGGALRVYGIIRGLAQAGHQITLMTLEEGPVTNTPLATLCTRILAVPGPHRTRMGRLRDMLLTNQADIALRFYSPQFATRLVSLLHETHFDVVQFEGIEVACYLPVVRAAGIRARLIFDTFNAEAQLQQHIYEIDRRSGRWAAALYSYIQSQRITHYEGRLCREADAVIAVSPEDAAILQQYQPRSPVIVIPSGIFVQDYITPQAAPDLPANALVFTGKMDYRPNVDAMLWFAFDIFPQLNNAHLLIVGQKPHPRIQSLSQYESITLTGWVDSVLPYLNAAAVYIAPLRMGSGTRLKILEAMACGCAIVATTTAAAGLNDAARSTLRIADDASEFAGAVEHLLDHPEQRQQLGQQAREAVRTHYDWSVLIPRLLEIYHT